MIITCREKDPINWELYQFLSVHDVRYEEPLMNNKEVVTNNRSVRTRAELEKFIISLGYTGFIKLENIKTYDNYINATDTYSMDKFIEDEIVLKKNNNTLIFEFHVLKDNFYLKRDIMSYVVSRLQWEYPEYHCIGKFV